MLDGKYRYIYPNKKISPRFLAGFFLFTTCEWYMSGSFLLTFLFFTCFLRVFYVPGLEFVFYVFFIAVFYVFFTWRLFFIAVFYRCFLHLFFITRFLSLVFYRAYANFLNNFRWSRFPGGPGGPGGPGFQVAKQYKKSFVKVS